MSGLTRDQVNILVWLVESGADFLVLVEVGNDPLDVLKAGGETLQGHASDVRELAAQGLLREGTGTSYELTNEGRLAYEDLNSPPPEERPPIGFI